MTDRFAGFRRLHAGQIAAALAMAVLLGHATPADSVAAGANSAVAPAAFFPVAVWYGGGTARAPMMSRIDAASPAAWGADLDSIKAVGFNTVKTWVDWSTAEPQCGVYNFRNLDLLLKLAGNRRLRVIIQIYLDSAPDWIGRQFPDARFVDRSGIVIDSQSAPGYCIDYAAVRREIVSFLEALSRDANRFPALYGWDVWSEPHVINWADFSWIKDPEFCFCQATQARFRQWLQAKYGTLDVLNAAWYRQFTSWDQVQAPRFSTILSYTDYIDWRAFIDDKLAGDLKTRVDAIRSADHVHPITSHADAPGLFTQPTDGYGEPDDWKMSATADFYGTSIYPKHSESSRPWPWWMLAAGLDFTRSAGHAFGKGFWIGELQAGQGATGMRIADPVTPQDEEFWMWQAISHGARETATYAWYPMSSGFESNGYGLIHLDGTLTERARAAGKTAALIAANAGRINASEPALAPVAVVYDRLSYMVGGRQPSPSTLGNAERDSLLGVYRAFLEEQIPVDFVSLPSSDLTHLSRYRIVFLPYPVMLPQSAAALIRQYIEGGGTVVAEARLAWNDERGNASPVILGFGLDRVFGARETMIRPEERPEIAIQPSAGLSGLASGQVIPGAAFEEQLEPAADARTLATFPSGAAAIVSHAYGHGKAILVGSFLGLSYQRTHDPATRALFLALAASAGVAPEVRISGSGTDDVEVRRLIAADGQLVFVFNHSDQPADASISISLPWTPRAVRDVIGGSPVDFSQDNGATMLRKTLPPRGIWVVSLDRP
ncbi:MAG TPA: beta-galactosidase [Acidobacteriaceae bacterium]|nr:beta-galactosidase [Acidobacteriaceae bacterium]